MTSNSNKTTGPHCTMTVILEGKQYFISIAESQTVLEAVLEVSLKAPHSCKSGNCTACKAKVTKGICVMTKDDKLDVDEVADGYILTCVAKPITKKVSINYDL